MDEPNAWGSEKSLMLNTPKEMELVVVENTSVTRNKIEDVPGDPSRIIPWVEKKFHDYDMGTIYNDGEVEDAVFLGVQHFWAHPDVTFEQKFNLINLFINKITGESDDWTECTAVSEKSLAYIVERERNFFLHALVGDFSNDKHKLDYSLGRQKEMIASNWETSRFVEGEETYFEGSFVTIPRVVEKIEDLSDEEIKKITDGWIYNDIGWFGSHEMRKMDIVRNFKDQQLEDAIVTRSQLDVFAEYEHEFDIPVVDEKLNEMFISKVSRDIGVLYSEGNNKEFFFLKDAEKSINETPLFSFTDVRQAVYLLRRLEHLQRGSEDIFLDMEEGVRTLLGDSAIQEFQECLSSSEGPDVSLCPFKEECRGTFNLALSDLFVKVQEGLSGKTVKISSLDELVSRNTLQGEYKEGVLLSRLYGVFSSIRMRSFMEEYFGFSYSEIPISAQLQFLNYVWNKDVDTVEKVKVFVKNGKMVEDKTARFSAFLSLRDQALSLEQIMHGCETLNFIYKDFGDLVLKKYTKIIETAMSASFMVKDITKGDASESTLLSIHQEIIRQANAFVKKYFVEQIDWLGTFDANGEMKDGLLSELDNIEEDALVFTTTLRALQSSGENIPVEDIKGVQFVSCTPEEFLESDINRMREIYAKNYSNKLRLRDALLRSFDQSFQGNTQREKLPQYFIFKHQDKIRGFYRLEETATRHFSFGAFNIDPTYRGYRFGETLLKQSLEMKAGDAVIEGDCDREAPVGSSYVENGFVGTSSFQFEEATAMHIVRNDTLVKEIFSTKNLSREEILASSVRGQTVEKEGTIFATYPIAQVALIPFARLNEVEKDGSRYVLTRSLREGEKENALVYAVFEKISAEDFERFMQPSLVSQEQNLPAESVQPSV